LPSRFDSCDKLFLKVLPFKDMLKARIVKILFSQIHVGKTYVEYTVETFTLDNLNIANQIESMVCMRLLCIYT
jgi:hypothetical protein